MTIELKQGLLLKSSDGEFVYNIFSYTPDHETMIVDILDNHLHTIATKNEYSVKAFREQLELGTILEFKEDEMIGIPK